MSIKNFGLATAGAVAGMIGGNYLYSLDKKANEFKEVPVPFYTVRKVAKDITNETKKMGEDIGNNCKKVINDIKAKCQNQEVHEMTDEEVTEELNQVNEQTVIDAEVVDGKAIEVDAEGNPVQQPEEVKVVGDTEEATIPQFTVLDQVPAEEPEKKKTTTKAKSKSTK